MWVFDVAWALAIFFGLRSLAARLLAVRIGVAAARSVSEPAWVRVIVAVTNDTG